jgi:hypothetical protein
MQPMPLVKPSHFSTATPPVQDLATRDCVCGAGRWERAQEAERIVGQA